MLNCGAQGVDLFFILSGFVTDLKLPRPDGTVVSGARHLALPRSRPVPSRRQLTAVSYVRLTCWCRMAGTVDKIVPLIRAQLSERY